MKMGTSALLHPLTGPRRFLLRSGMADSWPQAPKDARAKANPLGAGGNAVNGPEELSHGAGS